MGEPPPICSAGGRAWRSAILVQARASLAAERRPLANARSSLRSSSLSIQLPVPMRCNSALPAEALNDSFRKLTPPESAGRPDELLFLPSMDTH